MFNFIHSYNDEYWKGLEKQGFVNKNSGFQLCQSYLVPENKKFNQLAKTGSEAYNIVKELGNAFFIDRLQGGIYYRKYDFDKKLLDVYREMLGDDFLGMQIHEYPSVLLLDWERIRRALDYSAPPWSEKEIYDGIYQISDDKSCIHLSCGTPEEFSQMRYPDTADEYYELLNQFYIKRMKENHGYLFAVDSSQIALRMEIENETRNFAAECGAQIRGMRIQMAFYRGVSKCHSKKWGVYYETWGGEPFGNTFSLKTDISKQWYIKDENFAYKVSEYGETGGSSRALQKRIYYYSLLSGADYIAEEWGMDNTFYDWHDFTVSEYGKIKKDFIDFTQKYPDMGETYVSIGLVLPKEIEVLDLKYIMDTSGEQKNYVGRLPERKYLDKVYHLKKVLQLIFLPNYRFKYGSERERNIITNSRFGDMFDIIYEDAPKSELEKYAYLVDLNSSSKFYNNYVGGNKVIESTDINKLEIDLIKIQANEYPFRISGNIHWLCTRQKNKWNLAIFNNEGIERTVEKGDVIIEDASVDIKIKFDSSIKSITELQTGEDFHAIEKLDENTFAATVSAGDFILLEFK